MGHQMPKKKKKREGRGGEKRQKGRGSKPTKNPKAGWKQKPAASPCQHRGWRVPGCPPAPETPPRKGALHSLYLSSRLSLKLSSTSLDHSSSVKSLFPGVPQLLILLVVLSLWTSSAWYLNTEVPCPPFSSLCAPSLCNLIPFHSLCCYLHTCAPTPTSPGLQSQYSTLPDKVTWVDHRQSG